MKIYIYLEHPYLQKSSGGSTYTGYSFKKINTSGLVGKPRVFHFTCDLGYIWRFHCGTCVSFKMNFTCKQPSFGLTMESFHFHPCSQKKTKQLGYKLSCFHVCHPRSYPGAAAFLFRWTVQVRPDPQLDILQRNGLKQKKCRLQTYIYHDVTFLGYRDGDYGGIFLDISHASRSNVKG